MVDIDQDEKRNADTDAVLRAKFITPTMIVEQKKKPGRPKAALLSPQVSQKQEAISYQEVWLRGLLTAMQTFDVKTADRVKNVTGVADAVLEAYIARWSK